MESFAQTKADLERKRKQKEEEIQYTKKLLLETDHRQKESLQYLDVLDNQIKNRETLINKYINQTTSYVSGQSKQFGISCILDLVEKKVPPAPGINNLFFKEPELHGFKYSVLDYKIIIAVVFIDGNTINPSDYST